MNYDHLIAQLENKLRRQEQALQATQQHIEALKKLQTQQKALETKGK